MKKLFNRKAALAVSAAIFVSGLFFYVQNVLPETFATPEIINDSLVADEPAVKDDKETPPSPPPPPPVEHIDTPGAVKAVYMTACAASSPSYRSDLLNLIKTTEINSLVINIKDETGRISFPTDEPALAPSVASSCLVRDMRTFIRQLHENGTYVIGRMQVFQDPFWAGMHAEYAVRNGDNISKTWTDDKGLSWLDAGARPVWEYNAALMEEAYKIGFDEINLDYIRFPSDGNMRNIYYPHSDGREKADVIEEFFAYISGRAEEIGVPISADLFGLTATHRGDLNIGQVLERALPYFDAIAPMVYPSHYPPTFLGYANPAEHPYEIVNYAMSTAVARTLEFYSPDISSGTSSTSTARQRSAGSAASAPEQQVDVGAKLRPWLQDFDLGADYDAEMVRTQIQAVYDAGLDSWMLWSPSNYYTRGALKPAE